MAELRGCGFFFRCRELRAGEGVPDTDGGFGGPGGEAQEASGDDHRPVGELHGLMPTEISDRINAGVERVQRDIFENGGVRVWRNDGVDVLLSSPDNDVMIVFTHFLQHFFVGGVGLRQICDWCRLLWTYRDSIDRGLLEQRRTKAVVRKS